MLPIEWTPTLWVVVPVVVVILLKVAGRKLADEIAEVFKRALGGW